VRTTRHEERLAWPRFLLEQRLDTAVEIESDELAVCHRLKCDVDRGSACIGRYQRLAMHGVVERPRTKRRQIRVVSRNIVHQPSDLYEFAVGVVANRQCPCEALDLGDTRHSPDRLRDALDRLEIFARKHIGFRVHGDDKQVVVSEIADRIAIDRNAGLVSPDQGFAGRIDIDREPKRVETYESPGGCARNQQQQPDDDTRPIHDCRGPKHGDRNANQQHQGCANRERNRIEGHAGQLASVVELQFHFSP
jgi:hypothetical protein